MSEDRWTELDELLLDEASVGLDEAGRSRVAELAARAEDVDLEEFERLAGEIAAAVIEQVGEAAIPETLMETLMASTATEAPAVETPSLSVVDGGASETSDAPTRSSNAWLGWVAAASIALAWVGSETRTQPVDDVPVTAAPPALDLGAEFARLSAAAGAVTVDWTGTDDPAAAGGVSGAVVWDGSEQSGIMRFSGLEANDPTVTQYQLWIFDATRNEAHPVDGGVFDIPAGAGEVYVPIEAKLDVREPTLFAITVEPPGGVVVSDRSRIAVVAAVTAVGE